MNGDKIIFNRTVNTALDVAAIGFFAVLMFAAQTHIADALWRTVALIIVLILIVDRVIILEMRFLAGPLIDRWLDIYMRSFGWWPMRLALDVLNLGGLMLVGGIVAVADLEFVLKVVLEALLVALIISKTWLFLARLWVRSA